MALQHEQMGTLSMSKWHLAIQSITGYFENLLTASNGCGRFGVSIYNSQLSGPYEP